MAATQSLDISQYHKALEKRPINPENEKLLQELTSTDGGKAWVADHLASLISVPRPTLSGWAKSVTSIQATNYGGITYMKVNVNFNGAGGLDSGNTQFGGLFSVGGGTYWGTFWYDDAAVINSNNCTCEVNATAVALNMNFYSPPGSTTMVGTYVGGGVSTLGGIGGGSWQDD